MMSILLAATDPTSHVRDLVLWEPISGVQLTMHTLTLLVVTGLFLWAMTRATSQIATGPETEGNERYITRGRFAQLVESITVYIRDQMLEPVLGEQTTRRYLPYLMTLFFFILFVNVFGLIPFADIFHLLHIPSLFGGTATASITVTGALALVAFFVIQAHGIRELGVKGFLQHLCGGLVPGPVYLAPVVVIVFIVELMGLFIKPAALAIRLFANMVAGHTLMAVLLGFGTYAANQGAGVIGIGGVSLVAGGAAVIITFLELFVAFLQAFIFMFLTAVFISLMSHHDDHDHDEEHAHQHHGEEPAFEAASEPVPA